MLRCAGLGLMLCCFVLLAGCDGGTETGPSPASNASTGPRVTAVEKPSSVPAEAASVEQAVALGRIDRRAGAEPATTDTRRLESASCQDGVIAFETSQETIYAARGCDGFWNEEAGEAFAGKEVAIVLEASDERFAVLIETVEGAQAEFTVDGIWVE